MTAIYDELNDLAKRVDDLDTELMNIAFHLDDALAELENREIEAAKTIINGVLSDLQNMRNELR